MNERLLECAGTPRRRTARVLPEGLSVNPSKEYSVTDPVTHRAILTTHRADGSSPRTPLFSPAVRISGEDASDGPVDGWVDDVDGDWDDIVVPERMLPERPETEHPAPRPAPEPVSPESLAAARGVADL